MRGIFLEKYKIPDWHSDDKGDTETANGERKRGQRKNTIEYTSTVRTRANNAICSMRGGPRLRFWTANEGEGERSHEILPTLEIREMLHGPAGAYEQRRAAFFSLPPPPVSFPTSDL